LPLPQRDEDLYQDCLAFGTTCTEAGQQYVDARCNFEARVMQPSFGEQYSCVLERGCEHAQECFSPREQPGTLGTETCERSAACQVECRPGDGTYASDEAYLNSLEASLRPSLVDLTRRCVNEPTCAEFTACNDALWYLWQLTWHEFSGL
jgi:hypothetical protein